MTRKLKLAIGIAGFAFIAFIGNAWWNQGAAVRTASLAIERAQSRDWAGLYEMGLKEEITSNGWSSQQFSKLASSLVKHLSKPELQGKMVEVSPTSSGGHALWQVRNERHFQWIIPVHSAMAQTKDSIINLKAYKDQQGHWRIAVGEMVRDLNRSKRKGVDDVIVSLRTALDEAGLKRYIEFPSGDVISVVRLDRVIKGEIQWTELWQTQYDYEQGGA